MALGATHPDEKEAATVVESLIQKPIKNVVGLLVNLQGIQENKRFIDVNMAYAYPGDLASKNYEERRAVEVLGEIAAYAPDILVDLHNPGESEERFATVSPTRGISPTHLGMLGEFGIKNILLDDSGVIVHVPNGVAIEIPKEEIRTNGVEFVRQFISDLANRSALPVADVTDFNWFAYPKTLSCGLHQADIHPNELSPADWDNFRQFQLVPKIIQDKLGHVESLYLGCGMKTPNQEGYWGELLVKIDAPNDSRWPK